MMVAILENRQILNLIMIKLLWEHQHYGLLAVKAWNAYGV